MPEKNIVKINEIVRDLIPEFLSHRKGNIRDILDSVKKKDFENIELLGHRLKGVGKTFYFNKISEIGILIEQAAQKKDLKQIKLLCEQLSEYLNNVEVI